MRDIKFRAWDKKTKKMRTVESIGFGELSYYNEGYPVVNMIGRDCINDKDIIIHRDSYQHELMQYTGLKDKNGKEIYEGDIVKYKYIDGSCACGEIQYNGCAFDIENNWNLQVFVDRGIEVIGNKYEDKHLLGEI